jgi:hypothetical protein
MRYATEVESGIMVYLPSFREIGSGIPKLREWDSEPAWSAYKPTFFLFLIRKVG